VSLLEGRSGPSWGFILPLYAIGKSFIPSESARRGSGTPSGGILCTRSVRYGFSSKSWGSLVALIPRGTVIFHKARSSACGPTNVRSNENLEIGTGHTRCFHLECAAEPAVCMSNQRAVSCRVQRQAQHIRNCRTVLQRFELPALRAAVENHNCPRALSLLRAGNQDIL
jgi:hypothetical protein